MDEFDRSESMWKIDGPISRKEYIWVVLAMLFFAIPIFLLKLLDLATLLFPICIILALIILYLSFVSYAKRFYDIICTRQINKKNITIL